MLTHSRSLNVSPTYSPNGRWIAWIHASRGNARYSIIAMHPNGSAKHRIAVGGSSLGLDRSPTGTHLAFTDARGIVVVSAQGSNLHVVDPRDDSFGSGISYSPDGRYIFHRTEQRPRLARSCARRRHHRWPEPSHHRQHRHSALRPRLAAGAVHHRFPRARSRTGTGAIRPASPPTTLPLARDTARAVSEENVEALRPVYEEWGRGNWRSRFQVYDPEMEWGWSDEFPGLGGVQRDPELRSRRLRQWLSPWNFWRCEAQDFVSSGDFVVVLCRYLGRGKESGVDVVALGAHVWKMRDGKAIRLEVFSSREKALKAAGLRE
jgi:uncharacterized protein